MITPNMLYIGREKNIKKISKENSSVFFFFFSWRENTSTPDSAIKTFCCSQEKFPQEKFPEFFFEKPWGACGGKPFRPGRVLP